MFTNYYLIFYYFPLIILLIYSPINSQIQTSEFSNFQNELPEEISNRTYVQEQTNLQKYIFKKYDRKTRPVQNQSVPTTVLFHAYLMHFSVDQLQQTMFLNGHIYMTWSDDKATWDPSLFNNVRTTMVKTWEIWHPELRIANR
uniref:Neurotransmitter-gated ion-channel ligand-binding domain-containing protein n=1 Tax=Meloidogyne incognita TaxID=6306 RepID=A0A914MEX6_MELIC